MKAEGLHHSSAADSRNGQSRRRSARICCARGCCGFGEECLRRGLFPDLPLGQEPDPVADVARKVRQAGPLERLPGVLARLNLRRQFQLT
ncbi:hypothetical protein ABIB38_001075 [Massilia sp. UYP11]|uniref:hypothetical protein n=1 Tax=Massilia sp. UYP11 TaxID=1756385 RepID=UPI003D1BE381